MHSEPELGSLEPRPSSPRFYLAALEKNWGVPPPPPPDFSPRMRDKIWARKAWVRGYLVQAHSALDSPIFLQGCEIKSGQGRPGFEAKTRPVSVLFLQVGRTYSQSSGRNCRCLWSARLQLRQVISGFIPFFMLLTSFPYHFLHKVSLLHFAIRIGKSWGNS